MRPATGISGSSAALSTSRICVPRLAAWRRRWAISGWSCAGTNRPPARGPGCPARRWACPATARPTGRRRRRVGLAQAEVDVLGTQRADQAAQQRVFFKRGVLGCQRADLARKLSRTRDRPWATAWSASAQEASCHLPSAPLIMGADRRSSLFRPSYEKRSRSLIQHSLTASSSNGTTRMTRSPLTWMTRLAPRLSCGLTERRRASSQVRAL